MLYPTFFHEKVADLAPRFVPLLDRAHADRPAEGTLRLSYVADVVGVWRVPSLEPLRGIELLHGLSWTAVASRFHYRDNPGVQVVAVRVSRLPAPVEVPEARRYQGCVSWGALDAPVDVAGAVPVLAGDALAERVAAMTAALGTPAPRGE